MGCCFSKKTSPSSSSSVKHSDPNIYAIEKPLKVEIEAKEKLELEEPKPKNEVKQQEEEIQENGKPRKEVFVIKHRRSHEISKTTTDPEDSSVSEEKSTGSNQNPVDVDAILIQCGRLSRSNSAAKTRRYSGSKRSFDFDQNGEAEEADAEDGGEEEAERRIHRQRNRGGESPRERRRRTPSREREESKSYRSGSRERGSGSRRVSRSPGRRSETNPNSCAGSVSSVNSSNNKPAKFVSVPATDKATLVMEKSNNGDPSIKRITVKRNIGKAASPRSQSPARAGAQPSPSKLSRKTDTSPYRRNPLGEIDPNSVAFPLSQGNSNSNKRMMNRENDNKGLIKDSGNLMAQKSNTKTATQASIRRSGSPSRGLKEQQEAAVVEECKIVLSNGTELPKPPQTLIRSRSLRKSRDFDFSPEALLSNNIDNKNNAVTASALPSYTALLLEDIQNFHQKSVNVNSMKEPGSKACSIVEAVADVNSTTKNQHERTGFKFTSAASKKADLMEPSFEKYVTIKRGGSSSMEDMEDQESSGSNSYTGSSAVVQIQRQGHSSSSIWEPNSAESTDRVSMRSNNKERDRSPFGVNQEFDPLKKNGVGIGRQKGALVDSSSSSKGGLLQSTSTRVIAVSM